MLHMQKLTHVKHNTMFICRCYFHINYSFFFLFEKLKFIIFNLHRSWAIFKSPKNSNLWIELSTLLYDPKLSKAKTIPVSFQKEICNGFAPCWLRWIFICKYLILHMQTNVTICNHYTFPSFNNVNGCIQIDSFNAKYI